MSEFYKIAEIVRERFLTAPAAGELATPLDITDGIDILVLEEGDTTSKVAQAVAKARGAAIEIQWIGWRVADKNAHRPRLDAVYNIYVFSRLIITGEALRADDVVQSVLLRLWHWIPRGAHAFGEVRPGGGDLTRGKKYMAYDFDLTIPVNL